jgi:hypothetical protein
MQCSLLESSVEDIQPTETTDPPVITFPKGPTRFDYSHPPPLSHYNSAITKEKLPDTSSHFNRKEQAKG